MGIDAAVQQGAGKTVGFDGRLGILEFSLDTHLTSLLSELDAMRSILLREDSRPAAGAPKITTNDLRLAGLQVPEGRRRRIEARIHESLPLDPEKARDKLTRSMEEFLERSEDIPTEDSLKKRFPISAGQQNMAIHFALRSTQDQGLANVLAEELLNSDELGYVQLYLSRAYRAPDSKILGKSFLPVLVSSFEEFLGDTLWSSLMKFPNALGQLPQIPGEMVYRYESLTDLKMYQITQKVRDFLYKTPPEWRTKLLRWPGLDLSDVCGAWDLFIEIVNRRNIVVHNGGVVDEKYLDNLPTSIDKPVLGQRLGCSARYMLDSIAVVQGFSVCLHYAFVGKLVKNPVMQSAVDRVVDYLHVGEWSRALLLAQICHPCLDDDRRQINQVNMWMARQELDGSSSIEGEVEGWEPQSAEFRLARSALMRKYDEFLEVFNVQDRQALVDTVRSWPLCRRMTAEDSRVAALFSRSRGSNSGNQSKKKRKKNGRRNR